MAKQVSPSEAKFKINIKEGIVEIEGNDTFVERHLEKFEEICKSAIQDVVARRIDNVRNTDEIFFPKRNVQQREVTTLATSHSMNRSNKHLNRQQASLSPLPVDLKGNDNKIGLREFYDQKRPVSHYEKTAVFVYFLTKFNQQLEVKLGEILSCYEEVGEKKPSIIDIVKNSIRYKGWLCPGSNKFTTILTISGENFVGFDLPQNKDSAAAVIEQHGRDLLCR